MHFFRTSEDVLIHLEHVISIFPARGGRNEEEAYNEKGCWINLVTGGQHYHNDYDQLYRKIRFSWQLMD